MTQIIIKPKNKREEKVVEAFLKNLQISFSTEAKEEEILYKTMQKDRKTRLLNSKEKEEFIMQLNLQNEN